MRYDPYGSSDPWDDVQYTVAFVVVLLITLFATSAWVQLGAIILTVALTVFIARAWWHRSRR